MISEVVCVVLVLLAKMLRSDKIHSIVCDLVEKTFVVAESTEEKYESRGVKVFGDSDVLKNVITEGEKVE